MQTEGWKDFIAIQSINGEKYTTNKKCGKPVITLVNGKLHFDSTTSGAEFRYSLSCSDDKVKSYNKDGLVRISAKYKITAYAFSDGYLPSDKTTATLYWIKGNIETTNINSVKEQGILLSSNGSKLTISGLNNDEIVHFYSIDGKLIGSAKAIQGIANYNINKNSIVIAKIGNQSIKINVQ